MRVSAGNEIDVRRLLDRIGIDPVTPSAAALFELQRAFADHVPYETTWIALGEPWSVDPDASLRRIAHDGRGGYCFHVNGALARMLATLGYHVTFHVGGVHGSAGPSFESLTNHLVLIVHDLATDDNPTGDWYVDVGLGDGPYEPVALLEAAHEQAGVSFSLEAVDRVGGVGDWHYVHDPRGSFGGMNFVAEPSSVEAFEARHEWLGSSPESPFAGTPTVQLRRRDGVDILRGCILTRQRSGSADKEFFEHQDTWFDLVTGDLRLGLHDVDAAGRDRLWQHVQARHRTWMAGQAEREPYAEKAVRTHCVPDPCTSE